MKNVSIFKKIKLFRDFKKSVKKNKETLNLNFNLRIDNAYRLYTVLNIPETFIGEAYSLNKNDINKISENYIRQYSNELSKFLDKNGMKELYDFYEIKKVDKYAYLIIFGFSLFKSNKYYNIIYFGIIPTMFILSIFLSFFLI